MRNHWTIPLFFAFIGCQFPDYGIAAIDGGPSAEEAGADAAKPGPNLVDNPGCETELTPWFGFQGTATCDKEKPHTGLASFLVRYDSGNFYTLDRSTAVITDPKQGETVIASGWVRSSTPANGRTVSIILRQRGAVTGSFIDTPSTVVGARAGLSGEWTEVTTRTVVEEGRTGVYAYFVQVLGKPGDTFNVDDVVVRRLP